MSNWFAQFSSSTDQIDDLQTLAERFKQLGTLADTPQNPTYHAEGDALTHTSMVLNELCSDPRYCALDAARKQILLTAALLHDIGKGTTTRPDADGKPASPGHSRRGSIDSRILLWQLKTPVKQREQIAMLILYHQAPFFLLDRPDSQRFAIEISQTVECELLAILAMADARGRVCKDQARIIESVELFREFCSELGCLHRPWQFSSAHSRFMYFRTNNRDPTYHAYDDTEYQVTLMSGLPASGKDTWIHDHMPHTRMISLDQIRATLDIAPDENQSAVVADAREQAKELLRAKQSFLWNATNISREMRTKLINLFTNYGARVQIINTESHMKTLVERNNQRSTPVPEKAIQRMLKRWEPPTITEAHTVKVVDTGVKTGKTNL